MAEIIYKDEAATDLRLHLIPGLVEKSRFSILKQGNLSFGDLHIEAHIIGASHMIHYDVQGRRLTEVLACTAGPRSSTPTSIGNQRTRPGAMWT